MEKDSGKMLRIGVIAGMLLFGGADNLSAKEIASVSNTAILAQQETFHGQVEKVLVNSPAKEDEDTEWSTTARELTRDFSFSVLEDLLAKQ